MALSDDFWVLRSLVIQKNIFCPKHCYTNSKYEYLYRSSTHACIARCLHSPRCRKTRSSFEIRSKMCATLRVIHAVYRAPSVPPRDTWDKIYLNGRTHTPICGLRRAWVSRLPDAGRRSSSGASSFASCDQRCQETGKSQAVSQVKAVC